MKRFIGWGIFCCMVLFVAVQHAEAGSGMENWGNVEDETDASMLVRTDPDGVYPTEYTLGPGDVLEINTWKDDSLTKVVPILPDGKINFPLIGQVDAAGKTVSTLRQEIEERISVYVPDPYVGVSVQQVNSMLVYVVGKVNHPGRFVLNSNVNVLQVLTMAGGLNSFAKGRKIKIIRDVRGGQQVLFFDYDEVVNGDDLSSNVPLKRGDVVVVP